MKKPTEVVGRRVAAFLIDLILLTAINFAIFFLFADKRSEIEDRLAPGEEQAIFVNIGDYSIEGSGKAALYWLITTAISFGYLGIFQGITGWTLGKLALGIRVVDEVGKAGPGVGKGALRWVLWIVDAFPYFIPYLVGFIVALASDDKQRVGDKVAKTYVVRQDAVGYPPAGAAGGYGALGGYGDPAYAPQGQLQQQGAGSGAGWHPDPYGQARLRYWDGSQWTEHTSN